METQTTMKMYESRLKARPSFHFHQLEDVGERPVIIQDIPPKTRQERHLDFCHSGLIWEAENLAAALDDMILELLLPSAATLFVFPGGGGVQAQGLSRACRGYANVYVHAKRFWEPRSDPICTVGEILTARLILPEVEIVVALDDVISLGKTLALLHERNAWKFPRAQWIGYSWLSQLQRGKHPAGVKGYKAIYTSCLVVRADGKRVPINSLSTLLEDPRIAESYQRRYFANEPRT